MRTFLDAYNYDAENTQIFTYVHKVYLQSHSALCVWESAFLNISVKHPVQLLFVLLETKDARLDHWASS